MSLEQKYYEAPEFWTDGVLTNEGNLDRIRRTIEFIPADVVSLLDVGCGNGVFPNTLSGTRPALNVTATDRSREALKYVTTSKFESDITSIPRSDQSFDCVSCLQVIEHLPHGIYAQALAELVRVAKRYIIIGVPYEEDLRRDFTECPACLAQFNLNFHFRSYSKETIRTLFSDQGFRAVRDRTIGDYRLLYGQQLYRRLRGPSKVTSFESPLCPVCGYENRDFHAPSQRAEAPAGNSHWLKNFIKAVWPGYAVPGYWSIALYQRQ